MLTHRNEGFRYYPFKTYSELYVTDSTCYLQELHFNANEVELQLSLPITDTFQLLVDSNAVSTHQLMVINQKSIKIPLQKGIHTYELKGKKRITIIIDHDEMDGKVVNEFTYCNLPGPNIRVGHLADYQTGTSILSKAEINKATTLLHSKTHFYEATTDSARVMELCLFAASLCNNPKGYPFAALNLLPAVQQLDSALACRGELVCGNYTSIISFLASVGGLANRRIGYTGSIDTWQYGAHFMNEIYLRDAQQWVLLDGVNNIYLPHDSQGRYLNIVDIKQLVQQKSTTGKWAYRYSKGEMESIAYDSVNRFHYYYNRSNAHFLFALPNSSVPSTSLVHALIDFYGFDRNYSLYSSTSQNQWSKIFIRLVASWGLLALISMWGICEILHRYRKTKKH